MMSLHCTERCRLTMPQRSDTCSIRPMISSSSRSISPAARYQAVWGKSKCKRAGQAAREAPMLLALELQTYWRCPLKKDAPPPSARDCTHHISGDGEGRAERKILSSMGRWHALLSQASARIANAIMTCSKISCTSLVAPSPSVVPAYVQGPLLLGLLHRSESWAFK